MDNTITDSESMSEEPQSFTTDDGETISTGTGLDEIPTDDEILPDSLEIEEIVAEVLGVYLTRVSGGDEMEYAFIGHNPDLEEWEYITFGDHEQDTFRALIDEV